MNSVWTAMVDCRERLVEAMLASASSGAFLALASPSWMARVSPLLRSENMALRWLRRTLRSAADAFFQFMAAPVTRERCFSNLPALATTVLVRVVIRELYSFLALARDAAVAALVYARLFLRPASLAAWSADSLERATLSFLVAAVRSLANLSLWAAASARPTASCAEAFLRMSAISLAAIFLFWLNRARRKPRARLDSVRRLSAILTMRLREASVSRLILAWVALSASTMAVTAWR